MSTSPRTRRIAAAIAGVALLGTLALWLTAAVEKSPFKRSFGAKKPPRVLAGRDLRPDDERRVVRDEGDAAVLRCEYDGEGSPGTLTAMADGEVLTSGSDLSLRLPPGSWTVYWQAPTGSVTLGTLDAEAGDIETCRLTSKGWALSGSVRNLDGQPVPGAQVYTCGGRTRASDSGSFTAAAGRGTCNVRAVYRDGILSRRSEVVVVNAFDASGVELTVDDAPIAGMGLSFQMVERGARVGMIHPGTPAEEAGLEEDDVIVAVDGQPTVGISDDAFIALGTGREGSRISVDVERNGERRSFSFFRERIESVDTG